MPINVLHLIDTDKVCGPGKTILESAKVLQNTEFKLTIAACNYNKEKRNAYLDQVCAQGFDQVLIPIKNQLDPSVFVRLIKLLKEKKINILHSHGYKSDLFALATARLCRIKAVSTVHGWIQNNPRANLYVFMNKFILRYFDRVLTVSDKIREILLRSGVSSDKTVTIHNAINLRNYSSNLGMKILHEEYRISSQDILIGTIGRLSPEKGQKDLLEAFKFLHQEFPNCYCVIIGDGPDYHWLVDYSKSLAINKKVIFTGYRLDMIDIYKSLDIIVIPSYTEGLPNVALEAMAMNKSVVATRVGGIPEIISHGETGLLVEQKNPQKIADSIRFLLKNPDEKERIVKNARTHIEKKFSFDKRMEKVKNIYHELL